MRVMSIFSHDERYDYDFDPYDPTREEKVEPPKSSELTIECSSCGRELVEVCVLETIDHEFKIVVECPCGDKSFIKKVVGQPLFAPILGLVITDTEYEDDQMMIIKTRAIEIG
jgi:DNA-directed RNA polymerase subunit RPC12/RpoP